MAMSKKPHKQQRGIFVAFFVVGLISILCLFGGCGYTFHGGGSVLPPDVTKVMIPMVENNSTEPGLGAIVTEALRDQFERFGALSVVDSYGEADAVLDAKILEINRATRAVTSNTDTALQYNTTLTLAAELRRVSGPVLWRNPNVAAMKSFGTTSNAVVTSSVDFASGSLGGSDLASLDDREVGRGQEREALMVLAEDIARIIYYEAVAPDF